MPGSRGSQADASRRIAELERMISTLDWDLKMMSNEELKASKQFQLGLMKKELKALKKDGGDKDG